MKVLKMSVISLYFNTENGWTSVNQFLTFNLKNFVLQMRAFQLDASC